MTTCALSRPVSEQPVTHLALLIDKGVERSATSARVAAAFGRGRHSYKANPGR